MVCVCVCVYIYLSHIYVCIYMYHINMHILLMIETGEFLYFLCRTCDRGLACLFNCTAAQPPSGSMQMGRCRGPGECYDLSAPW